MANADIADPSIDLDGHDEESIDWYQGLIEHLSEEEKAALEKLAFDPPRHRFTSREALCLLTLGLAQWQCGRLIPTSTGRNALTAMRGA